MRYARFFMVIWIVFCATDSTAADFKIMLEELKKIEEPAKGRQIPLPEAITKLEELKKDSFKVPVDAVVFKTYSTMLNEKSLIERYGKPDKTGKFQKLKTLQYDWLEIAVTNKGEIRYATRVLNPKKPSNSRSAVTIEEKSGK